jgi:hypothetical protein
MDTPAHPTPQHHPSVEEIEETASFVALAGAVALRAVEIGVIVLIGLIVCPPLFLLSFLVIAPLVVVAIAVSLVAAVIAAPYLLIRHLRGHEVPHAAVYLRRLRHAAHAIAGLLPHHVVREARRDPLL